MMNMVWSQEIPFDTKAIEGHVPPRTGVYRILQSEEYPRYEGLTRILKIGMSKTDLHKELLNHFQRHTSANRLYRIRRRAGINVTVDFIVDTEENAIEMERKLLKEFEDDYWDLPILNSQRGYARDEDRHYRK